MLSTLEIRSELASCIAMQDNESVVSLLEILVERGDALDEERMLLGVLLFLPPVADYDAALETFEKLLQSPRSFEAASWQAYCFANLHPDGSRRFEEVLKARGGSIAQHLLSLVSLADGNYDAFFDQNMRSRQSRLFPFNILSLLDHGMATDDSEKSKLISTFQDLVVSNNAESDSTVFTVDGLLSRKWDGLILGTRLSSPFWQFVCKKYDITP